MPTRPVIRVGGYLPDPEDPEDQSFTLVRDGVEKRAVSWTEYVIPELTPISDQGNLGSCVANAWVDSLEMILGLEHKQAGRTEDVTQLSRLFVYWTSRCRTNDQKYDNGTYLRNAAKQLMTIGVPPESFWPYSEEAVFQSPTLEAYNIASDNKINGLFRVGNEQRARDVEIAIRANHPVVFGTDVGSEFMDYAGEAKVFDPPKASEGGHAMILVGVRRTAGRREFMVRNSWSEQWGVKGHAWISQAYLDWSRTSDIWFGTRVTDLLV